MAHYVVRPLTRLQTLVARNMCRAQQETAHATLHTTCDVTLLHEAFAARRTGAASLTSHVLHACTRALQEHPALNAHLVDDELCIYHEIKLGLMLEAGDAVMVGCIPDAAGKTPHALEVALADLHARAASHQLLVEETRGATFMVADLSALPVDTFTPILLPTAIAILGIGRVRAACRPADQGCTTVQLLSLSLTIDHRGSDGLRAGRFLGSLVRHLEAPAAPASPA
jgi:pyruvate dehydrogenase E2 component (dihydrolipoamide acetyltransferase)